MREEEEVILRLEDLWADTLKLWEDRQNLFNHIMMLVSGNDHLGLLLLLQKGPLPWGLTWTRADFQTCILRLCYSFVHSLAGSFIHSSLHPFHFRIHSFKKYSFNIYIEELELGTFDAETKATVPPLTV